MSCSNAPKSAPLGSRPRVLARRSLSARQPARDPKGADSGALAVGTFRSVVWGYWKKEGRHDLPWRKTRDPYRILVSEMMLQQTQVPRVIEKYEEFLRAFPTIHALAEASLAEVLRVWGGLGYNRRAKYVREIARGIMTRHAGGVPREYDALRVFPGIGDYTARAVRVFAFNEPDVLIETNVRTALIYHFFSHVPLIRDGALWEYVKKVAAGQDPRMWHWALMDYGTHLKRSGIKLNARRKGYVKQSRFEGSLRQVRGAILRELRQGPSLVRGLPFGDEKIANALTSLACDGLIVREGNLWRVA